MCFQNIISYQYQIPLRCLYLYWQSQLFISNQKYLISYCTVELPDTTWYSHVFTNHIEVSKVSCLQWHVSSIELNMQLRDILNHLKPTAEAAASTSVFVHLILGQNTYMCFTTLGALPKHFFGFDIPSRSGQPQLSNLTYIYRTIYTDPWRIWVAAAKWDSCRLGCSGNLMGDGDEPTSTMTMTIMTLPENMASQSLIVAIMWWVYSICRQTQIS
jgi:hypothetical protein